MSLVFANISLSNPRETDLEPIEENALVDSGAITLIIPEHIRLQLKYKELEKREVKTTDGKNHLVPYVGPVQIKFKNRSCFTGAFVLGDSVLMGALPMEDMDLVVHPSRKEITVNPKSPNIPTAIVK